MNKDRRSIIIVVNRVIIILDLVSPPYRILWTFDLKKFKTPIITFRYDRAQGRVFALLKTGTLVMMTKNGDIKKIELIDFFGKKKILIIFPIDDDISFRCMDFTPDFLYGVICCNSKKNNFCILMKISEDEMQMADIWEQKTRRKASKGKF